MATIYSDYQQTGEHTKTRVRITYDGINATATLLFTQTADIESYVGAGLVFYFADSSNYIPNGTTYLGEVEDGWVSSVAFRIPLEGGTFSGHTSDDAGPYAWSGSITIPSQVGQKTPYAATMEQWQDLASRVKDAQDSTFTDDEWNGMWS